MPVSSYITGGSLAQYTFDSFQALPCGCVAGVYRTRPRAVEVVALEARGPHCLDQQHELGTVLGLGINDPDRLSR